MLDLMKIKLGTKTHKGARKQENDDRTLIGMDPAANDWLFSPGEIQVGEFGTLLLVADGLGDQQNGGIAANIVCQTVRKLFDETLELPPDEEDLLRLLSKFLKIAHRQILLRAEEMQPLRGMGASATLVLLRESKAYIVWTGNCRVYRYRNNGVAGSVHCALPRLETLTVDHSLAVRSFLYGSGGRDPEQSYLPGLTQYMGDKRKEPEYAVRSCPLHSEDRLLLCTEGLYQALLATQLEELLGQAMEPEMICEDLVNRAFNQQAKENMSAILVDIIQAFPPVRILPSERQTLEKETRLLVGAQVARLADSEPQDTVTPRKATRKDIQEISIPPIKLRTVLPDPDYGRQENNPPEPAGSQADTPQESGEQVAISWDIPVNRDEEAPEPPLKAEWQAPEQPAATPRPPLLMPEEQRSVISEKTAGLRIRMTVYPDAEEKAPESPAENTVPDLSPIEDDPAIDNRDDIPETSGDETQGFYDDVREASYTLPEEEETDEWLDEEEIPDPYIAGEEEDIAEAAEERDHDLEATGIEHSSNHTALQPATEHEEIDTSTEEPEPDPLPEEDLPTAGPEPGTEEIPDHIVVAEEEDPESSWSEDEPLPEENTPPGTVAFSEESPVAAAQYGADAMSKAREDSNIKRTARNWIPYAVILGGLVLLLSIVYSKGTDDGKGGIADLPATTAEQQAKEPEKKPAGRSAAEEKSAGKETVQEKTGKEDTPSSATPPPAGTGKEQPAQKEPAAKTPEQAPKTKEKEPVYDEKIRENKHQLVEEIRSLISRKNDLCNQINTYRGNAPARKKEDIQQLSYDCGQMDKKFASIYDTRSGYFKTVRYDFLSGTIKNIKQSIEILDKRFDAVRKE